MQYSVVNKNGLVSDMRLDAEAYLPLFFDIEKEIRKHDFTTFDQESSLFVKGIFDIKADCYLESNGVPFVRIGNLKGMLISKNEMIYIPEEENSKNKKTFLKWGDIILSKTAYPAASFVNLENCNTSQDTIAVKLKPNSKIRSQYLVLFLNSRFGFLQMKRWFTGNIQMHLNLTDGKNIEIPIFSDDFQGKLQNLFQESINQINQSKSLYSQAEHILLSELGFLDWKPKHELAFVKYYSDTQKTERIDAEYFQPKYEEIIEAVKKYKGGFVELGEVAKTKRGSLIPDSFYSEERGTPYIRGADFSSGFLSNDKLVCIDKSFLSKTETKVKKGDIVFALIGTVGSMALVDENFDGAFISNNLGKITTKKYNSTVLQVLFHSIVGKLYFEKEQTQTAQPKISDKDIHKFILPKFKSKIEEEIEQKYFESQKAKKSSKSLLEIAKRGVEKAIEKDEHEAEKWIKGEIEKLGITI